MQAKQAKEISRTLRGYNHLTKLLETIDKKGTHTFPMGNTGVDLTVSKDDAMYYKLMATRAALREQIAGYEIIRTVHIVPQQPPTVQIPDRVEAKRSRRPWTEERRANFSEKMKEIWRARRSAQSEKIS